MRSSKHQKDFGHVLDNQNRLRVSSFIQPQNTRRGTNFMVLGGKMLWKHVIFLCDYHGKLNQTTITIDSKPCLSTFLKRDQVLQTLFNPLSKLC